MQRASRWYWFTAIADGHKEIKDSPQLIREEDEDVVDDEYPAAKSD